MSQSHSRSRSTHAPTISRSSPHDRSPDSRRLGRQLRIALVVALLGLLVVPTPARAVDGEFHVSCNFSHRAPDDPIVYPGDPGASHMHTFFGNRSTDAGSTYRSMRRARTTCSIAADASGYWIPSLVDHRGRMVAPRSMTAYYRARSRVQPPPRNLRMIAGGDTARLKIAGYSCGGGDAESSMPLDCGNTYLKGVVVFPSCWNGRDLDSRDHRSHMAYPSGRGCPARFPVRIPKISYHITFGVYDGTGYTLSSDSMMDMRHGMSLHADFWNAWAQPALARVVDRCLNGSLSCDLE